MKNSMPLNRLNPYQMMKPFAYLKSVISMLMAGINGFRGKQNKAGKILCVWYQKYHP
jgi:hypothetical protein